MNSNAERVMRIPSAEKEPSGEEEAHHLIEPSNAEPVTPQSPKISSATVTSIRIVRKAIIEVEVTLPSGRKLLKRHDLDRDLGNDDGTFTFTDGDFSWSARNILLSERMLSAELCDRHETWRYDVVGIDIDIPASHRASDISIRAVDFEARHAPIMSQGGNRLISSPDEEAQNLRLISDSVLAGECLQSNGRFATSYVDLDGLIGNNNGCFSRGGTGYFYSGNEFCLRATTLSAQLWNLHDTPVRAQIHIGRIVRIASGRLVPYNIEDPLETASPIFEEEDSDEEPLNGCRSAHLVGATLLVAKTVLRGGRLKESALRMNELFGVVHGEIRPFGHDYHLHDGVVEKSIKLDGSILSMDVEMQREDDEELTMETRSIDLSEFIEAKNGALML